MILFTCHDHLPLQSRPRCKMTRIQSEKKRELFGLRTVPMQALLGDFI